MAIRAIELNEYFDLKRIFFCPKSHKIESV